jgi:hypothetical protein
MDQNYAKQNKNLHKFSMMDYSDFLKKKEFEEIRTLRKPKVSITDIQNEVENKKVRITNRKKLS